MAEFIYVSETDRYKEISSVPSSLRHIQLVQSIPQGPTATEIRTGYMERYFARPVHHTGGEITEVSKSDYEQLKLNSFYTSIMMIWRVSGKVDDEYTGGIRTYTGVKTANALSLEEAEKTLAGMIHQVRDSLQFFTG